MPEDRSLDDFLDGDDDEEATDEHEESTDEVAPATTTASWSSGAVCQQCGREVGRRWRVSDSEGGLLVCADCKEW